MRYENMDVDEKYLTSLRMFSWTSFRKILN